MTSLPGLVIALVAGAGAGYVLTRSSARTRPGWVVWRRCLMVFAKLDLPEGPHHNRRVHAAAAMWSHERPLEAGWAKGPMPT